MQFPEITAASIEVGNGQITSENWAEGLSNGLVAEIGNEDDSYGRLRVCYSEDKPFLIPALIWFGAIVITYAVSGLYWFIALAVVQLAADLWFEYI